MEQQFWKFTCWKCTGLPDFSCHIPPSDNLGSSYSLWSGLSDPHTRPTVAQGMVLSCWRGRCGSSTRGCWPQPSTMTSWSPPWGTWPTLSSWWWWIHLSLIWAYSHQLNPQFTLKQIYPSNIHQTQPPRIMCSIPETDTSHTRVHNTLSSAETPFYSQACSLLQKHGHIITHLMWHTPQHTCATAIWR